MILQASCLPVISRNYLLRFMTFLSFNEGFSGVIKSQSYHSIIRNFHSLDWRRLIISVMAVFISSILLGYAYCRLSFMTLSYESRSTFRGT